MRKAMHFPFIKRNFVYAAYLILLSKVIRSCLVSFNFFLFVTKNLGNQFLSSGIASEMYHLGGNYLEVTAFVLFALFEPPWAKKHHYKVPGKWVQLTLRIYLQNFNLISWAYSSSSQWYHGNLFSLRDWFVILRALEEEKRSIKFKLYVFWGLYVSKRTRISYHLATCWLELL